MQHMIKLAIIGEAHYVNHTNSAKQDLTESCTKANNSSR
jgi:hypothetical protein